MRRIRIGNDIILRIRLTRRGGAENLEGKKIGLMLRNILGSVSLPVVQSGEELIAGWQGTQQQWTGAYTVTLTEDWGENNRNTVDEACAFELVSISSDEGVETGTVNIELDMDISVPSNGLSAYEIALLNGFEGTEEEWLESLKGERGEPFEYSDFTPEQINELKRPATEAAEIANSAASKANSAAMNATTAASTAINAANAIKEIEQEINASENSREEAEGARENAEQERVLAEQARNKEFNEAIEKVNTINDHWDNLVNNGNALASDVSEGKELIADALVAQGQEATPTDSYDNLAGKIRDLHLWVPDDPAIVDETYYGKINKHILMQEIANHKRAGYEGMVGFMYENGITVDLKEADAYWCSDDYFTEEGGEHTIIDTDASKATCIVILYYKNKYYNPSTNYRPALEIAIVGGVPTVTLNSSLTASSIIIYSEETERIKVQMSGTINTVCLAGNFEAYIEALGVSDMHIIPCMKILAGGSLFSNKPYVYSIYAPTLVEIKGGSFITHMVNVKSLYMPSLEYITGGIIASNVASLERVNLPSLKMISSAGQVFAACNALVELDLPALESIENGTLFINCNELKKIALPVLKTFNGAALAFSCPKLEEVDIPVLESITIPFANNYFVATGAMEEMQFPALKEVNIANVSSVRIFPKTLKRAYMPKLENCNAILTRTQFDIELIALGAPQNGDITIAVENYPQYYPNAVVTVENGFRSNLNIKYIQTAMTREKLLDIINNLADNSEGEPLNIVFGDTNMAKLEEGDIEIATAKNYTLS